MTTQLLGAKMAAPLFLSLPRPASTVCIAGTFALPVFGGCECGVCARGASKLHLLLHYVA